MERTSSSPAHVLTVVVIVLGARKYLTRCLKSLVPQAHAGSIEIIVPHDDGVSDVSMFRSEFPSVQFLTVNGYRTYAELRARAVQKAQGDIISITEDHCIPSPDWCAQILRAHTMPHAAIGGAVDKVAPDSVVNWAMYLADYVRYMNPAPEGQVNHLTDCNVSYKRAALASIATVWAEEFHEPDVHGALQARGENLWFSPRIIVRQQRSIPLADAIRDRYSFGRLFGSGRAAKASAVHRVAYASIALLLPPLMVMRIARHVFQKRQCVLEFFRAFPATILLNAIWAWGEFVGYLTGRPGTSLTPRMRRGRTGHGSNQEGTA
jgi:glycosyltransferase involved in cell wall biosynthesis